MMKILIIGMYYSGSSAVLEWLKDFNTIDHKNEEFDIYHRPGKISDLLSQSDPVDQYADQIKNNILHLRNVYTVDSHSSNNYYTPDNTAKSFTQILKERHFYVDENIDALP
jgi:hypothetical protein